MEHGGGSLQPYSYFEFRCDPSPFVPLTVNKKAHFEFCDLELFVWWMYPNGGSIKMEEA